MRAAKYFHNGARGQFLRDTHPHISALGVSDWLYAHKKLYLAIDKLP